jgi:hypothetical protein
MDGTSQYAEKYVCRAAYLLVELALQTVRPFLGDMEGLDGVVQVTGVEKGHEDKGTLIIVVRKVVETTKTVDLVLQASS